MISVNSNRFKKSEHNSISLLLNYLRNISLFITLFAFVFTIVVYEQKNGGNIADPLLKTSLIVLFFISFFCISISIARSIRRWYKSLNRYIFVPDRNAIPNEYGIFSTLEYLEKNRSELCIISRTSFSYLCGDEREYQVAKNGGSFNSELKKIYEENNVNLLDALIKSISNGSTIHFILMNPNTTLKISEFAFNKEKRKNLIEHFDASIESYKKLLSKLPDLKKSSISLSIVDNPITNSMLRLKVGDSIVRFQYDIGVEFLDKKPMIIFTDDEYVQQFNERFEAILNQSKLFQIYEEERKQSLKVINKIVIDYPEHSKTRNDKSEFLGKEWILSYKNSKYPNIFLQPAPTSVQLLITNICTTTCIMCNHYALNKATNRELDYVEIINIIDHLKEVGAKSLIISGGEPLAHNNLIDILKHAKSRQLKIGLLTNGIKPKNLSINESEAKKIIEYCDWIQVSLDSFNRNNYKLIRNSSAFDVVLSSIKNLINAKSYPRSDNDGSNKTIEICYTIQKANIKELEELENNITALSQYGIDKSMLRFKFAHGPDSGNNNFICDNENEIRNILRVILPSIGIEYLQKMILKEYYTINGITHGKPVRKRILGFQDNNYTCQVLNLTCIIDAMGDIYPCCFLYDDNISDSSIRSKYCLGSLRESRNNVGMITKESVKNFMNIWGQDTVSTRLRKTGIPIDYDACQFCIRHCYQNEFLNKLHQHIERNDSNLRCFELEKEFEIALKNKNLENDFFWI